MNSELQIKEKLPVLSFNFEQLRAWATELAGRYAAIAVTEEAIADVKRDMADLNKARKAVDDARKEAVRRVSEPIRAFETQIKEVCAIFDAAYSTLGEQVKAFEDAQREEKRKVVMALILEEVDGAYGTDGPRLAIHIQDSWLNKSASLKSVREAVQAIIQKDVEDERRRKALEQAAQDRAAAVENHVVMLNKMHGMNMPVTRFLVGKALDLNAPLDTVLAAIGQAFEREKEKAQREQEQAASAAPASPVAVGGARSNNAPHSPAPPAQTRAMSVVFEYDIANETQVQACLETLKPLCVNYGARNR